MTLSINSEKICPLCEWEMKLKKNNSTDELFWICTDCGNFEEVEDLEAL